MENQDGEQVDDDGQLKVLPVHYLAALGSGGLLTFTITAGNASWVLPLGAVLFTLWVMRTFGVTARQSLWRAKWLVLVAVAASAVRYLV